MAQKPKNFILSSDYPTAYIAYAVETPVEVSPNQAFEVEITHNLGFTPLLDGYWSDFSDFKDTNVLYPDTSISDIYFYIYTSANKLYISGYYSGSASKTIYVKLWGFVPPDYNGQTLPVSDSTNFLLNSDYAYLSLYASGLTTVDGENVDIVHNLGYVPQFRVWVKYLSNNTTWVRPVVDSQVIITAESGVATAYTSYADDRKLHLRSYANETCYYHIYTSEGLQNES